MSNITLQAEGRRIYVAGNSFPIKDAIKSAGGHWDGGRKQWWIGAGKKEEIERAISATEAPVTQDGERAKETASDETQIRGKATYKGKTYFMMCESRDGESAKLTTLDGKIVFWAKRENGMEVIKRYEAREERGNYGRGTGRYRFQTLGSIRSFIANKRGAARENHGFEAETKQCWECGGAFTFAEAKANGGDWRDSYCGC